MSEQITERREITKEVTEEYLALLAHGADKFDIEEMYQASNNLGYKQIHIMIIRCILTGDLDVYHHLILNVEYYQKKYQVGGNNDHSAFCEESPKG